MTIQQLTGTGNPCFRLFLRAFLSLLTQFIIIAPLASRASWVTLPPSAMMSGTEHAKVSTLDMLMLTKDI